MVCGPWEYTWQCFMEHWNHSWKQSWRQNHHNKGKNLVPKGTLFLSLKDDNFYQSLISIKSYRENINLAIFINIIPHIPVPSVWARARVSARTHTYTNSTPYQTHMPTHTCVAQHIGYTGHVHAVIVSFDLLALYKLVSTDLLLNLIPTDKVIILTTNLTRLHWPACDCVNRGSCDP